MPARLPGVYPAIKDGGLAVLAPSGDGLRVIIGTASSGTVGEILAITDPYKAKEVFGRGNLVNAIETNLLNGGGIVYAVRCAGSVAAGVFGSGTNITLSGTPDEFLEPWVEILKAGAVGTATFRYSLDGGFTWSSEIITASTYAIPGTPLTLGFTGTHALGVTGTWRAEPPLGTVAEVTAAVNAVVNSPLVFQYIHVAQAADNAFVTSLATLATSAETTQFKYFSFIAEFRLPNVGESADTFNTAILTAKGSFTSKYVTWVVEAGQISDPIKGRRPLRNLAANFGARVSSKGVAVSAGWVDGGTVPALLTLAPFTKGTYGTFTQKNQGHALALDNAGLTAVYTLPGRDGYFFVEGRTAAASTSDYSKFTNKSVMDKAAHLVRAALLGSVNLGVDVVNLDAALYDLLARAKTPLRAMQGAGEISGFDVKVPVGQDILATSTLRVQVSIVPLGYLREITLEIGFANPLLAPPPPVPAVV
jgi:Protein of unknown function (DUF2586)